MQKKTAELVSQLDKHHRFVMESNPGDLDDETIAFFNDDRLGGFPAVMYIPHTKNYKPMLERLSVNDVVCDMGAGDLRFALMAAEKVKKIYAVEFNPETLGAALSIIGYSKPRHLVAICCDWRRFAIPADVTVVTCMVNSAKIPVEEWTKNRKLYVGVVGNINEIIEL